MKKAGQVRSAFAEDATVVGSKSQWFKTSDLLGKTFDIKSAEKRKQFGREEIVFTVSLDDKVGFYSMSLTKNLDNTYGNTAKDRLQWLQDVEDNEGLGEVTLLQNTSKNGRVWNQLAPAS